MHFLDLGAKIEKNSKLESNFFSLPEIECLFPMRRKFKNPIKSSFFVTNIQIRSRNIRARPAADGGSGPG